jgi:hypothetical protein
MCFYLSFLENSSDSTELKYVFHFRGVEDNIFFRRIKLKFDNLVMIMFYAILTFLEKLEIF